MANKTLIPAIKARVGDWDYYICSMKYAEVARQIAFAYELGGNKDLATMIQRGISKRTQEITSYLLRSEHRFLGALIVACWGGDPQYIPVTMEDSEGMLADLDQGFGVLTFDGTQQYFALDGQHRLKAIKDALKKEPELGAEEVCVLLVSHYHTPEGRERTRRLFTNINRNAKVTTAAENIALDEDDGFAILTRRFLADHEFLSQDGVVRVFTQVGEEGELRLATGSIPKAHKTAWTAITVLYEMLVELGFDLNPGNKLQNRPSDDDLEVAYKVLSTRIDDLLRACGDLRAKLEQAASARDIRAPKNTESSGHPFMRPVIQKTITRVVKHIVEQNELTWDEALKRLRALDWRIGQPPWNATFEPASGKMISGKDFTNLLFSLLYVHLAPQSKMAIKRARKQYKELRGSDYPISEEILTKHIRKNAPQATETRTHKQSEGDSGS